MGMGTNLSVIAPSAAPLSVSEVVKAYLDWAERTGHYTNNESWRERKRVLAGFTEAFGTVPVVDLLPHKVMDWALSHRQWKSTSTIRAKMNTLARVFNWATKGRRIAFNPLSACDRFPEAPRRPCLEDSELGLLCTNTHARFATFLRFLRASAFRLGEACNLTWPDIDFEKARITLKKHKTLKNTGKASVRYLGEDAMAILKSIHSSSGFPKDGFVFRNDYGRQMEPTAIGKRLRELKDRLGIKSKATCHGLRHQAATVALRNKAPMKAVSLFLGHGNMQTTEKYYGHLEDDEEFIRNAAQAAMNRRAAPTQTSAQVPQPLANAADGLRALADILEANQREAHRYRHLTDAAERAVGGQQERKATL
jgi:integrase